MSATRGLIMLILMPDVDLSTESFEEIVLNLKQCHDMLRSYPIKDGDFKYADFPVKLFEQLPKSEILRLV